VPKGSTIAMSPMATTARTATAMSAAGTSVEAGRTDRGWRRDPTGGTVPAAPAEEAPPGTPSLGAVTTEQDIQEAAAEPAPEDDEHGRAARAVSQMFDPAAGWTTAKVVLLVLVSSVVVALLAVTLSDRVERRGEGSVEVGFLQDMLFHHEQAVQLGVVGSQLASDPDVSHFALEAVVAQQYEIGYMEAILEEWGHGHGDPDRTAMAWMDMPTSLDRMPGMATDEELRAFRASSGAEADAAFLRLMNEHHRGGVHMAEYAAEHATDERVRSLAERMARNQRAEMGEYAAQAERLGIAL